MLPGCIATIWSVFYFREIEVFLIKNPKFKHPNLLLDGPEPSPPVVSNWSDRSGRYLHWTEQIGPVNALRACFNWL